MRLWRISTYPDLSGEGGLLASGRWHSRGRRTVYLADHPAGALVEVLVHLAVDPEDFPATFQLLAVDVADDIRFDAVEENQLDARWREDLALTRGLGDQWLGRNQTALLRVPSAIVPTAVNWILNPGHADSAEAKVAAIIRAPFDPRFFRTK
jgi:RES domain-containing protein